MTSEDLPAAARIAARAFGRHPFYQKVLGFNEGDFSSYWSAFLPLALDDPSADLIGLKAGGQCLAMVITADEHFPASRRAFTFGLRLLRRVGPRKLLRYLRFVAAYERIIRGSSSEESISIRALWLFVAEEGRGVGLGRYLARSAQSALAARGKTIFSGLIDASDERLIHFYQRLGFRVSKPFSLFGAQAARIEIRIDQGGPGSCRP
jgi:ribosomal protein S18 acetylase RimI-like enzyme